MADWEEARLQMARFSVEPSNACEARTYAMILASALAANALALVATRLVMGTFFPGALGRTAATRRRARARWSWMRFRRSS